MSDVLVAKSGTRDVVGVSGDDATSYLQGQLSQDVAGLSVGDSTLSLILSPQGKVDAWVRVTRRDDNDFWLDVDAGFGDAVAARLKRFLLRTAAEVAVLDVASASVRVLTPAGDGPGATEEAAVPETPQLPPGVVAVPALGWPVGGYDLFGSSDAVAQTVAGLDVVAVTDPQWELLRIRSKVPAMGHELTQDTIPAAAGIVDGAVSFTKGCYTGQELVARIDSRGNNVPRSLCTFDSTGVLSVGSSIVDVDGNAIAVVTSAAPDPFEEAPDHHIGLGYVNRSVDLPATGTLAGATVQIESALTSS